MAASTLKGRISSGTGDPEDLSASDVKTILNLAVADVSGAVSDTDARLSDSRTPTSHAASHLPEGDDELFDQSLNQADDVDFNSVFALAATFDDLSVSNTIKTTQGFAAVDGGSLFEGTIIAAGDSLTDDRSYQVPDADGTLALTSDIPAPSTATPQALGTAAAGTSDDYSRADHIHAAPALNDLSNVSAATPSDNDVLVFDTATGNWVAEAPSGSFDPASPDPIGSTTPNTGAFTSLTGAPAANTAAYTVTGYSLTGSNAQSLLSLSGTWNTTGTPIALGLDITDTASNDDSELLRLGTNGHETFKVSKNGNVTLRSPSASISPKLFFENQANTNVFALSVESGVLTYAGNGININSPIGLSLQGQVTLLSEGANILSQRRSTNAQTFRIFNTFTSATNFERVNFRWASNEFIIDAEAGSVGGTLRGIKIGSASTSLLGFFGATPVAQQAAVADATDAASTQDRLNDLLARLRTLGLIAT